MAGTFTTRNTPILAADNGTQSETLGGTLLLTDFFAVPVNANSAWLQPATDILFRMDGDEGGSAWLTLPAKTFLPLTNRSQLQALVLSGSSQVGVIFMEGALGPMPPAPIVASTGGGGVPGEGTVTSVDGFSDIDETGFEILEGPITGAGTLIMTGRARVDTDNALHVMVNGDDATGTRGRLDKPYSSVQEALAQSEVGDTIYVWPGSYTVNAVNLNGRNIYLLNAELVCDFNQPYMFDCFDICSITGEGDCKLRHVGGLTDTTILNGNINCDVTVKVASLTNNTHSIAIASGETTRLTIEANLITSGPNFYSAFSGWETLRVNADLNAALVAYAIGSGHTVIHTGNITAVDVGVDINEGDFVLYGDIRGRSTNGEGCIRANGVCNIRVYGAIAATGASMPGIRVENGGADIEVYGPVSAWTVAAIDVQASDVESFVRIHGDITCLDRHGILTNFGNITVWGNITTTGVVQDANCVHAIGDSIVRVYGHLSSDNGAAAKTSDPDAVIEVFGNAYSANRWGAFTIAGGHIIVHGIAESGIREGAYVEIGRITLLGGAKGANNTAAVTMLTPEVVPGNLLTLGGGCFLESNGTALYAVDCNPGGITGVRSYGAYGNKQLEPTLVPVGTFNVV
jgi:hypothetical protein